MFFATPSLRADFIAPKRFNQSTADTFITTELNKKIKCCCRPSYKSHAQCTVEPYSYSMWSILLLLATGVSVLYPWQTKDLHWYFWLKLFQHAVTLHPILPWASETCLHVSSRAVMYLTCTHMLKALKLYLRLCSLSSFIKFIPLTLSNTNLLLFF
jgi:hypothetical protein